MKYKRIILTAFLVILAVIICGCSASKTATKPKIAVITKSTSSDFWHGVESGVNAAVTEYNIDITYEGPNSEEDYSAQNRMIESAIEDGCKAIVFSANNYSKNSEAVDMAKKAGLKVVMIDSDVDTDFDTFIGTDNFKAGEMVGEASDLLLNKKTPLNIGIVNYDKESANGQQREAGLRKYFKERGNARIVSSVNVLSTEESATTGAYIMITEHPEINVLIGLNEWTTLGVGNAVKMANKSNSITAIGFDSNVTSVKMLETGEMDALIVQNPFAIGYFGVKSAYELINSKPVDKNIATKTSIVTKHNMFDANIQKILFRFE